MQFAINWVLMILAVLGAIQLAGTFILWLHKPKQPPQCMTVAIVNGNHENMEQIIRYIRMVAQWSQGMEHAILLDTGLSENQKLECQQMCEDGKIVEFITWEDAKKRLDSYSNVTLS